MTTAVQSNTNLESLKVDENELIEEIEKKKQELEKSQNSKNNNKNKNKKKNKKKKKRGKVTDLKDLYNIDIKEKY